jgi:hypothetical protein
MAMDMHHGAQMQVKPSPSKDRTAPCKSGSGCICEAMCGVAIHRIGRESSVVLSIRSAKTVWFHAFALHEISIKPAIPPPIALA